jgi:diguanylate cyclase (GGDEF)-like protein
LGTSGKSRRVISSRPERRSEEALFSRLRRMGRARNFDLELFEDTLRQSGPGRRPDLLCRLLSDWIGRSFDPRRVERTWAPVPELFAKMRERLGAPLSLQTVLLHHFHTLKGLFPEPLLLAARDVDRLRVSAITDPLTGLYNRRFLSESLRRHLFRAERSGDPVSIAMLDLENFKSINDRFGHAAGDRALLYTANTISESLRPGDIACRWGGDEFILLLPRADFLSSVGIAERLRRRISANSRSVRAGLAMDLYYGIASVPVDGRTGAELIAVADERLYECREQRAFLGGDRRRHPRFAFRRMRLRLLARGRSLTAFVVNVSYSGLAFQARGHSVPPRSQAEISHTGAEKPRPIRIRVAHAARLPGGRLRVGAGYSQVGSR